MPLALSTGHEVGLAVTAAAFIIFALASSFLFPRLRPDYPGRGLLAFIVVALVFFFGMLAAVETFGAESKHEGAAAETPSPAAPQGKTVAVDETEFKITTPTTTFKTGTITFEAKNVGKIPHDLAIKGTSDKTSLIQPGGSAKLSVDLKPGKYLLYCTVPGHEAAGMKLNITVTSSGQAPAPAPAAPAPPSTSTKAGTTTTAPAPTVTEAQAAKVAVSETEFKITLPATSFKTGKITFDVKNAGKIPHDLAIKGTSDKTKLIQAGGAAQLTVTLKPGTYELYCTVPGHEAAGMKQNITVT